MPIIGVGLILNCTMNNARASEPQLRLRTAEDVKAKDVIVVTEEHARPIDLEANSPVFLVNAEEFSLSGYAATEQVLNQFPQIVPGASSQTNNPGAGFATLDLRGLGAQRTLVLVNGRRWIPADISAGFGGTDINTIPAVLIERVEVITGGAASIYGGDALGGAVNFITRDRFQGVEATAQISFLDQGDGETYNVSALAGTAFGGGRGHVTVLGEYYNRTQLLGHARPRTSVDCFDGAGDLSSRGETPCGPAGGDGQDVLRQSGSSLIPEGRVIGGFTLPEGGRIGSILFLPDGNVRARSPVTDFYNFAPLANIRVPLERYVASGSLTYELTDNLEVYGEAAFVDARSWGELAPTPIVEPLEISIDINPHLTDAAKEIIRTNRFYNPATGSYSSWFLRRMLELGTRQADMETNATRVMGGLRGQLSDEGAGALKGWQWDAYYLFARTDLTARQHGTLRLSRLYQGLLLDLDSGGNAVCRDPSNGCLPLNVFGAGNLTPEMVNFIAADSWGKGRTQTQLLAGSLSGDIAGFPAGKIHMTAGMEYRVENVEFMLDPVSAAGDMWGFTLAGIPVDESFDVWELYSDAQVPIVSDRPFAKSITLDAGVRVSEYSTVGTTLTFKGGGEWAISDQLRLRGLFQRAKRPPNILELYAPQSRNFSELRDFCDRSQNPVTNGLASLCIEMGVPNNHFDAAALAIDPEGTFSQPGPEIRTLGGGNPALMEETADTWTVGAVIQPAMIDGLSLTLDWYDITAKDVIATAGGGAQGAINLCALSDDAKSEMCQWILRTGDGTIGEVSVLNENLSSMHTSGLDVSANYAVPLESWGVDNAGSLHISGTFGWVHEWIMTPSSLSPARNCASKFGRSGTTCSQTLQGFPTPDMRSVVRATWEKGSVTISAKWRWIGGLEDMNPNAAIPEVGGRHYLDLTAVWKAHEHVTLNLGAENVTQVEPPRLGSSQTGNNTLVPLFESLGTRIFAGMTTNF